MNTQVRPFVISDTERLFNLFQHTVRTVNSKDYSPAQIQAWVPEKMDLVRWQERFTKSFTLVVEADGEILGFSNLEPGGRIDMFYIHADFQGRGIGTLLMNAIIAKAEELRLERLFSEVSITAKPFFLRKQFTVEQEQTVRPNGVSMTNFLMLRSLR